MANPYNLLAATMLQPKKKGLQKITLKTLSLLVGVERFELPTPCSQSMFLNLDTVDQLEKTNNEVLRHFWGNPHFLTSGLYV